MQPVQGLLSFEQVAVYFTKEEWALLGPEQRVLHRRVMVENFPNVASWGNKKERELWDVLLERATTEGALKRRETEEKQNQKQTSVLFQSDDFHILQIQEKTDKIKKWTSFLCLEKT